MKLITFTLLLIQSNHYQTHHTNIKGCRPGEFNYLDKAAYDPMNKTFMTKSKGIVFQEHLPIGTKVYKRGEEDEEDSGTEGEDGDAEEEEEDSDSDDKHKDKKHKKLTLIYSKSKHGEFYIIEKVKCK
ncbi:hypothetical protein CONCODRAFT_1915 [Conidiobolus coronatus NRRL 28638]|uniref:Uncharacterized protein n=1 Tax=Conidiobolus coronatus (strain ATCC 28846 / CBS 209.66 / NRRL 28638) TaxID=796925 RepID=A0A137PIQ4_CONC2|nr:hypothetical protein CONCODRAFT_1915 [Conidiobolus coronatus NRRL 28638]|eukprot:KXN74850.1 hypothetical protein CONCODRAFT_1915 [Conidiobolus coronatus NRRL 28638]